MYISYKKTCILIHFNEKGIFSGWAPTTGIPKLMYFHFRDWDAFYSFRPYGPLTDVSALLSQIFIYLF
jgi:hypothetical protein